MARALRSRIHRRIQEAEHGEHRKRNHDFEACKRALLVLELATPCEVVAFRHRHAALYGVDGVLDHRSHVSPLDVELQGE